MDYCFEFNCKKNLELLQEKKISFEQIIALIEAGCIVDILNHPNQDKYKGQRVYVIDVDYYCYLVQFVIKDKQIFLNNIIPTGKATKNYNIINSKAKNHKQRLNVKNIHLSDVEQEILSEFQRDNLVSIESLDDNKAIAEIAAQNFTKKTERINIRLKYQDLNHIKRIAAQEGMPYQTLIASVLHKYALGYLKLEESS